MTAIIYRLQEDSDASLNRLKEKFERETVAHLESKQKMADMETYLNEIGQQLQMVQQEKMKLEHILNHSGCSLLTNTYRYHITYSAIIFLPKNRKSFTWKAQIRQFFYLETWNFDNFDLKSAILTIFLPRNLKFRQFWLEKRNFDIFST